MFCDRYKHARQTAVDPQTNEEVPLFHPRQQIWSEHFAWNEDRTRLVGLTPTGRATVIVLAMNRPRITNLRRLWVKLGYLLDTSNL